MVYCKLDKVKGNKIQYSIGGYYNDLTGKLIVDYVHHDFDLIKQPENSVVWDRHIEALVVKEQSNYDKGVFREKIAYEI